MASFWTLLLQRPRHRTYARLDGQGRCQAFKTCAARPQHGTWVEVSDQCLAWLGQPLAQSARIRRNSGNRWQGRSVTA